MIEMTPEVRKVLSCRSAADKICVPIDCDIAPVGLLPTVSMLVREGYLTFMERTVLPHLVVLHDDTRPRLLNADIYRLTPAGVALCEFNDIAQH